MAKIDPYAWVEVELFLAPPGPYKSRVRVRPVEGQGYPDDTVVECSREVREKFPIGTRIRLQCKLTDREGGKPFLYSNHNWPYETVYIPK